jgi:hypothetical protein
MPRPKTHFEQVPLEVARKIAEREIEPAEPVEGTTQEKPEDDLLKAST